MIYLLHTISLQSFFCILCDLALKFGIIFTNESGKFQCIGFNMYKVKSRKSLELKATYWELGFNFMFSIDENNRKSGVCHSFV